MTDAGAHATIDRFYLLYHELRPGESRYSYAMSADRFGEQVAMFARRRAEGGASLLPEVTFDDGHRSDYEIALPILAEHGLRATFFITVGWTERRAGYMEWAEVRALARAGHRVGAHGWSHALLTQCSEAQLQLELGDARKVLEDKLGMAVDAMSLPGGRGNRRVLAACRSMGYGQVFTSRPGVEGDPAAAVLGRLNVRGDATPAWMAELLAADGRLRRRLVWEDRLKQAGKQMLGDSLYARLWRVLNRAEEMPDGADVGIEAR